MAAVTAAAAAAVSFTENRGTIIIFFFARPEIPSFVYLASCSDTRITSTELEFQGITSDGICGLAVLFGEIERIRSVGLAETRTAARGPIKLLQDHPAIVKP